jgi:transposase, IS5 family
LRIYLSKQWDALADEALEDARYDGQKMQHFARIRRNTEVVLDATTLLKFRCVLATRNLCKSLSKNIKLSSSHAAYCGAKDRGWTPSASPRPPRPRTKNAN